MTIQQRKKQAFCAVAMALALYSGSALAKTFSEKDFHTQALGHGVYELAYDNARQTIYAASSPSFAADKTTGILFELAADSLAVKKSIDTERRIFALALDQENHVLWMGNALDGSITALDTRSGKAIKTLQLSDASDPRKRIHPREAVLDKKHQRLYISGMGGKGKGLLWVVDTQKQALTKTLEGMDPVGFAVDAAADKVYAVTGSGELVTLDGKSSEVLSRVKVDPKETDHYFLNIALNPAAGVGYIADTNTRDVLVVELATGKLKQRIATPNSIAALYNGARNEVYVTHRNDRQISVIDAKTNAVKHTITTAAMPNSLVLSPDASTLYVSVKQDEKANKADYVLKIDLTQL